MTISLKHTARSALLMLASAGLSGACGKEESFREAPPDLAVPPVRKDEARATVDQVPARVRVSQGSVEVGFDGNSIVRAMPVQSFLISRYPVTVNEYSQCVFSGVCRGPGSDCLGKAGHVAAPREPASCVGHEDARAFCRWANGAVANLAQWMLAARGPVVQRYAWGSGPPDCGQHPSLSLDSATAQCTEQEASREVGAHPRGASPSGMEDVLLTATEMVEGAPSAPFTICEGTGAACLVHGGSDGRLMGVQPIEGEVTGSGYGFRCVWSER